MSDLLVIIEAGSETVVEVTDIEEVIILADEGPQGVQGPQGVPGIQGIPGPPGSGTSSGAFIYTWQTLETLIVISHNLGHDVNVDVTDTAGTRLGIFGCINLDPNTVQLSFLAPVAGTATIT